MTFVAANGFVWVAGGVTVWDLYLRALTFSGAHLRRHLPAPGRG